MEENLTFRNFEVKMENMIIFALITSEEYKNKVMPIINDTFFKPPLGEVEYAVIIRNMKKLYEQGVAKLSPSVILSSIKENEIYIENEEMQTYKDIFFNIGIINKDIQEEPLNKVDIEYLLTCTENYIRTKAIENALMESAEIMEEHPEKITEIKEKIDNAMSIKIDNYIGMDYTGDAKKRFESYQEQLEKIRFNIKKLNDVTNGGFERKTLNLFMAGTGIGKTLLMCSLAADYLRSGYNVLYVTLEISENRIGLRVDANLLDIPIGEFGAKNNGEFVHDIRDLMIKFNNKKENEQWGDLVVREYPTSSISSLDIRSLLKELELQSNFKPDVIMIDYINLLNSARLNSKMSNSYNIVKSISEELRGIAVEYNCVMISATQTNRDGIDGDEVGLSNVSESAGVPFTADFFCGIFQSEQQKENSMYQFKTLKSRYSYGSKKFILGVDYSKMRVYEFTDEELEEKETLAIDIDTSSEKKSKSQKKKNDDSDIGSFFKGKTKKI